MLKNTAGQNWIVYAYDSTTDLPKTGDALNITANLRIDGAGADAVDDTNPAELEDGYYIFDLTQAETNGNCILMAPSSVTANIQVYGCPQTVCTEHLTAGYSDGSIWIDTNASNTNIVPYVDGTSDNPVSTWAAAKNLGIALNSSKFTFANGSEITLDDNTDHFTFRGFEYTVNLGGQSIAGIHIEEATILGIATSGTGTARFFRCRIGVCTLGKAMFTDCSFVGSLTLSAAADYVMKDCFNATGSAAMWMLDFGGAVGNSKFAARNWNGGAEIANLGTLGDDELSVSGRGLIELAATCAGGKVGIAGHFKFTDDVVGGFTGTIVEEARCAMDVINEQCDIALTDYGANTTVPDVAGTATTLHAATDAILAAIQAKTDTLPAGFAKGVALTAFPFNMVLKSDHYTAATGLSVTCKISKDGGAFTICTNTPAEISVGFYKLDLTAAEMNADLIALNFVEGTADDRNFIIKTDA